jgi:hypothetical protein
MAVCLLAGCGSPQGGDPQENAAELVSVADGPQEEEASQDGQTGGYTESGQSQNTQTEGKPAIDENGSYSSKEDVALYIHLYGHLPSNYITKREAERLGWTGGSLEPYAPGCCIGGSHFGNYEGLLPEANGRSYTECDIGTIGKRSRGAKRIVFSNDGLIFYTDDHYESFELLYGEVEGW